MRLLARVYNYSCQFIVGYIVVDTETCKTKLLSEKEIKEYLLKGNTLDNARYDKGRDCLVGTEGSLDRLPVKRYDSKGNLMDFKVNILAILQKGIYDSTVTYKVLNHAGETRYIPEKKLIKFIVDRNTSICNARVTICRDKVRITPMRGAFKELDIKQ